MKRKTKKANSSWPIPDLRSLEEDPLTTYQRIWLQKERMTGKINVEVFINLIFKCFTNFSFFLTKLQGLSFAFFEIGGFWVFVNFPTRCVLCFLYWFLFDEKVWLKEKSWTRNLIIIERQLVRIPAEMNAKKTAEAEEHLRLAAKALKTGLLKWNPDYDTAGDEYSRAATAFKVSIWHFQAVKCFNDLFHRLPNLVISGRDKYV